MDATSLFTGLAIGLAAGGVAWFFERRRAGERQRERDERDLLVEELKKREMDLTGELRAQETTVARVPGLEAKLEQRDGELLEHAATVARLKTDLDHQRKATEEKLALLEEARIKLADAFKALASDALQINNAAFLQLASENMGKRQQEARAELEKRQQAIGELVTPLREQLGRYEQFVQQMEGDRKGAYEKLLLQVDLLNQAQTQLKSETKNLVDALRKPHVRGQWGELMLKRTVEMAGMVEHCDFFEQETVQTEAGQLRPDMVIHLPNGRRIVVDAKTPLEAYLDAIDAPDDAEHDAALKRYANHVQTHMDQLAQKKYWEQLEGSPEFVVLFLSSESFLTAAVQIKPDLLERGFEKLVILATPSTLVSLLRTVALGFREKQLTEKAREISDLGQKLYERLQTMTEHIRNVGKNLDRTVRAYNQTVASLESRVLVTARKFPELGVGGKDGELPELTQLDVSPTSPTAPDLFEKETPADANDK